MEEGFRWQKSASKNERRSGDHCGQSSHVVGLERVALRNKEAELKVAEMKTLRFSFGVTKIDRIMKEYIRATAHV